METQPFRLRKKEKMQMIWRYLRPVFWFFAAALACACLSMVFNALTPQIIKLTVDVILDSGPAELPRFLENVLTVDALRAAPVQALWLAALAVLVTALLRGVCSYGQRINLSKGSEGFVKAIRDDLFSHIQRLSFQWHTAHSTGDMIQRCTSDVDVIRSFVCNQMIEVVRTVFLICLYMCIMFSMNLRLSLVALAFIPVVGLSSGVFYAKISSRFKDADEAEGALTTCAQENLTGIYVHGSLAFGCFRWEKSDVDFLVKFGESIGLFELFDFEQELTDRVGRKVDLVNSTALERSPCFAYNVKKEMLPL